MESALREAAERHLQGVAPNLKEAILYSLMAPGKRIRSRLCLESAKAFALSEKAALPVALAVEMVHCFTLIHDDLPCMDNDDFRRGRPSNHKKFGEALALLAGDSLLGLSYDVFQEAAKEVPQDCFHRAFKKFSTAIGARGVIGGQAREMLLNQNSSYGELKEMFSGKTSALFEISIMLPLELKGMDPESQSYKITEAFSRSLGFGFQVADDLDDFHEDSRKNHSKNHCTNSISILSYRSIEEAQNEAWEDLNQSCKKLNTANPSAQSIINIGSEVLKALRP